MDSYDSLLVDSGASRNFTEYKEFLSNLFEMETSLTLILGDNTTHLVKGFGFVKFHLDWGICYSS